MVCVPITDRENLDQLYPCHVELKKGTGGLEKNSVALCEQVRAIAPGQRLIRYMGKLEGKDMKRIEEALRITLALECD
jgi:mRNA-degrading endonuclease toxin of MazEF toxin-antitoxin module